jgi:hypothetical protein
MCLEDHHAAIALLNVPDVEKHHRLDIVSLELNARSSSTRLPDEVAVRGLALPEWDMVDLKGCGEAAKKNSALARGCVQYQRSACVTP